MKILIAFILLSFTFTAKSNEPFNKIGVVANECNQFENLKEIFTETENDSISLKRMFTSAMQGFLSGINYGYENRMKKWKNVNHHSIDFMFIYIKDYCSRNPNKLIEDGLFEYFFELPDINK
tara:strand:- start:107 stop:472 length:366 start_codon:yes stop_codon:yes gene_type:complete